ncbi:AAA family ATPase [Acidaminococcus fermentans]|uniref:AAA family ATPase n=1 Tax=Acidaminococcus fermentans TaxID=905 RepID=UPI003077FF68
MTEWLSGWGLGAQPAGSLFPIRLKAVSLVNGHSAVTLLTRPRRFGKTLTLSMLDWFEILDQIFQKYQENPEY